MADRQRGAQGQERGGGGAPVAARFGLASLRRRLTDPQARQIAGNTSWLIAERVLRGVLSLVATVVIARYLGRAEFGTLNYALSFVLLFATLWQLGLSGIVVRELVRSPEEQAEMLGTVFALRLAGGVAGFLAIVAAALLVAPDDPATRISIIVLGLATIFYAFEGIDFWLQSRVMSQYAVLARLGAVAISVCVSLVLVVLGAPVVAFAAAASLEFVVGGLGYLVAYLWLQQSPLRWTVSLPRARALLALSWPLIVSGVFNAINLRIDQLMLGNMRGAESVGVYAAAARLSEVWYFVPLAIATATFPALIRSRDLGPATYARRVQRLMDLMIWLSVPLALAVTVSSGFVIQLLYGDRFADAAPMLAVHIWAGPFVFMGVVLSRWLIAEGHLKFSFVRTGIGAAVNIGANLLLIPQLGGNGAAIATLVSYAAASYFACLVYRPTWPMARVMSLALMLPIRTAARVTRGWRPRGHPAA